MKLGLGTAQFGLDYGISNRDGKTQLSEVKEIINLAKNHNIMYLDTAPAYGDSEKVIGQAIKSNHQFKIITKTPKFSDKAIRLEDRQLLIETFHKSLSQLNQQSVYGLLVHHGNDLLAKDSDILMDTMMALKQKGLIQKIGVSIYTKEQIEKILDKYSIDLIQVPVNIFDQRLLRDNYLNQLQKEGIEIHARSIFLQGLLLMGNIQEIPEYFNPIKTYLIRYHSWLNQQQITPLQASLDFIKTLESLEVAICGINSRKHLQEILEIYRSKTKMTYQDFSVFFLDNPAFINPANWRV